MVIPDLSPHACQIPVLEAIFQGQQNVDSYSISKESLEKGSTYQRSNLYLPLRMCNEFDQERQSLLIRVPQAKERADLAYQRAEQMPAQRPSTAYGTLKGNTEGDPTKQALKSVFTVYTNLAQALSEVRAQLSGGAVEVSQGAAMRPTSTPRLNQSTTQARERDALDSGPISLEGKYLHASPENHKDLPSIRRPGWTNVYRKARDFSATVITAADR
ncbi:hypothetical protein R1sor_019105 [Riccia sorocarpa]|uniref:Uncharacterized protein n=1 Tax=Riccia sorocarpa TaxID=122646 RepID=A0ABD3IBN0_9MARC